MISKVDFERQSLLSNNKLRELRAKRLKLSRELDKVIDEIVDEESTLSRLREQYYTQPNTK